MKQYIRVLLLVIFFQILAWTRLYAQLPDFRIGRIDSTYFSLKNIIQEKPVLFMYFSPSCDNCEEMTKEIIRHIKELSHVQIVMITNESLNEIKEYYVRFNMQNYKNIIIGTEGYTGRFAAKFQFDSLPFLVFYNRKKELMIQYSKQISANNFITDLLNLRGSW